MRNISIENTGLVRTLSLFSGAGGLDIGFSKAGFDIVACIEINEAYCKTLEYNGKHGFFGRAPKVIACDIAAFDPGQFRDSGIECVIGGPPCQTFSAAGRRSGGVIGTGDERGNLFKHYCRILSELQPSVFVFENVYGLPGANGGDPWRKIISAFGSLGYKLSWTVLDAADYGVPQHRERLLVVGTREERYQFPLPTHGPDSENGPNLVSVQEAIADLQVAGEEPQASLGGLYGHLLRSVPEGLNYSFFTAEMGHPEPVFAWRSKFHDLLYKVSRYEPCRTIKAQPGKFTGPFHWNNRHFTNAELKRLQTFPDDYEIIGSDLVVMEQIGNSVPPRLAEVLAVSIKEQILRKTAIPTYPSRPDSFKSTFRQRQREKSKQFKTIAAKAIAFRDLPEDRGAVLSSENSCVSHDKSERFFLRMESFFSTKRLISRPRDPRLPVFAATLEKRGRSIALRFDRSDSLTNRRVEGQIRISGLAKYMLDVDTLTADFWISEPRDLFALWLVIQDSLCSRSQFFTLIDIYGHYANRGDAVVIETEFGSYSRSAVWKALQFFGNSASCGTICSLPSLSASIRVPASALSSLVETLRSIRFDVRTSATHPTLQANSVLCTYPFPLLSQKALTESRAKIVSGEPAQEILSFLMAG